MSKVKESRLNSDLQDLFDRQLVDMTYANLEYRRLYKAVLLRLLSNPAMVGEETPTAQDYVDCAKNLTIAALEHLNAK